MFLCYIFFILIFSISLFSSMVSIRWMEMLFIIKFCCVDIITCGFVNFQKTQKCAVLSSYLALKYAVCGAMV